MVAALLKNPDAAVKELGDLVTMEADTRLFAPIKQSLGNNHINVRG